MNVSRLRRDAAQKTKSERNAVSNRSGVREGGVIGGPPSARGTYAAGTTSTNARQRFACRSANCIDEGAPAEAPRTTASATPS